MTQIPPPDQLTRWLELGRSISSRTDVTRWQIGDWFLSGEEMFNEDVFQHVAPLLEGWVDSGTEVFNQPTLTETTLKQYAWMSQSYTEDERAEGISYTSHRLVAKVLDRSQWLHRASLEGWTAKTLKAKLIEAGVLPEPKARVQKWSADELDELLHEWYQDGVDSVPAGLRIEALTAYIQWLREREA